jgi:hypothetical protein
VSSGEGSFDHPSPRQRSMGGLFAPTTTTWKESTPTALGFPPWTTALRLKTNHASDQHHAHHKGQLGKPMLDIMLTPRHVASLTRTAQAHCPITMGRVHGKADIATSSGARLRNRAASPPSTPPSMRRSCTALHRQAGRQPRVAIRRHRPTTSPTAPKTASKAATSGVSINLKGPRP